MVRIRSREATIVGLLTLFAAPCAVETHAGQPYSVVGQSTAQTAATGRRPIAERIKAANRPIRIKAEADLAPDEGLIRDLSADARRDWPIAPPVVELPGADPIIIAAEATPPAAAAGEPTPAMPQEPAVVPPPAADAVAANPTTADDAGAVGEVGGLEEPAPDGVAAVEEAPSAVDAPPAAAPAAPAPRPRTAAAPRRPRPAVTPQRREALLDRLRAALAEMPRPFGLIPAPAPAPAPRRTRTVAPRAPLVVAAPPALEAAPAAATDPSAPGTAPAASDVASTDKADGDALAAVPTPAAGGLAADATAPATDEAPRTEGVTDEAATTALAETQAPLAPAVEGTPEVAATETPATETPVTETPATDAVATTGATGGEVTSAEAVPALEAVPAGEGSLATTEQAAEEQTPVVAPRRAATPAVRQAPRPRAPAPVAQRPRPFSRLQATLDALPRPLGILPAPRPAMRGPMPQPRRDAATIARSQPRRPAPVAPEAPSAPADTDVAGVADATGPTGEEATETGAATTVADAPAVADSGTDTAAGTTVDPQGTPAAAAEVAAAAGDDPAATEPAPPGAAANDALATLVEEPAACIEVVVEGPEGGVARGEEVTLRLSVRNTGTAAARAVTPMFHFGRGIEPRSAAGRVGTVTRKGSVVFESLPELAPGECLEVDVVAVCEHTGAVPFRAAVWCGEGDAAEEIPLDGELRVVPGPIASAPGRGTVR